MNVKQMAVRFLTLGNRLIEEDVPEDVVGEIVKTMFDCRIDERDDFEEIVEQIKETYDWFLELNKAGGLAQWGCGREPMSDICAESSCIFLLNLAIRGLPLPIASPQDEIG